MHSASAAAAEDNDDDDDVYNRRHAYPYHRTYRRVAGCRQRSRRSILLISQVNCRNSESQLRN